MAVDFLDYQVIQFEDQNQEITKGYFGSDDFVQLIDINDFTKFQIKSSSDGNYPNTMSVIAESGWLRVVGSATYQGNNDDLIWVGTVVDGLTYELTFNVTGMTQGSLFVGTLSELVEIQADGTYTLIVTGDVNNSIIFQPDGILNSAVTVSGYSCQELPINYKAGIFNTLDVFQSEITEINYSRNFATFTVDWAGAVLTQGQYKFGLLNKGNVIPFENGGFDSTAEWVLVDGGALGFSINNSALNFQNIAGTFTATATNSGVIESGKTYNVSIYIKENLGNNVDVTVKLGTTAGATNSVVGAFTEQIVSNGTDVVIEVANTGNVAICLIEAIYITEVVDIANETPENFTNLMCLQDIADETIVLSWCNLSDAQGLGYGDTGFINIIRTDGKVTHPKGAEQEYSSSVFSDGKSKAFYHREKEVFDLITGFLPPRLHRALMYARGADFFAIDNQGFRFQEGDYEPQWSENSDFIAFVVLEVYREQQALPKIRCIAGANPDCSFPPSYWVWSDGGKLLLSGEDGGYLLGTQF